VLAAAVFAAALVRPSRNTLEAALAAAADVRSTGALLCVRALPAAVLTALLVEVCKTLDAALAARDPVPFFIMVSYSANCRDKSVSHHCNKHTKVYTFFMGRKPKDDFKGFLFIADHIARFGKPPSFEAIRAELDYGSKRSVQLLLERLATTGRITYEKGGTIDIVHKSDIVTDARTVDIPFLAEVPCGPLEEAIEDPKGPVKVSISVAKPGSKYFILRAKGDSMNLSEIESGDLMLIRQQATADDNDIVVALVNGAATVKRFRRDKGFVVLTPESKNPEHKPMILTEDFAIQGKFIKRLPDPF